MRIRPPAVVAASAMLATGGALFALEMYLAGRKYFTEVDTYDQAVADHATPNLHDNAIVAVPMLGHRLLQVVGVFAGVALVALAIPAFFGWNWARAVSWILGLPALLWYGLVASVAALGLALGGGGASQVDDELSRRLDAAWPPWLDSLDTVLMVTVSVLLIGALVCQTVPAADRYFRRRTDQAIEAA
jgi:hypothetical protein